LRESGLTFKEDGLPLLYTKAKNKPFPYTNPNFVAKISKAIHEKPKKNDAAALIKKGISASAMDDHIKKRNFEEMYSTEEKFGQKKDSMDET
jgi:hypothetical protein